jgi:hypothetical protein
VAGTGDVDGAGSALGVGAAVEDRGSDAVGDGPDDPDLVGVVGDVGDVVAEPPADGLPAVELAPEEEDGTPAEEADAGGVRLACPLEDDEHPAGVRASAPVRAPRSRAQRRMSEPERLGAVPGGVTQEVRAPALLGGLGDGTGRPAQGCERAQEPPVGLVRPRHRALAAPAALA